MVAISKAQKHSKQLLTPLAGGGMRPGRLILKEFLGYLSRIGCPTGSTRPSKNFRPSVLKRGLRKA